MGGFYNQTPFKDAAKLKQEPLYYNHLPTGRPIEEGAESFVKFASNYLDVRNDPLYPFGYGLSYTTFSYSDISLNGRTASVTVTNTGDYDGDEIVQLYIHDVVASIYGDQFTFGRGVYSGLLVYSFPE